jgi:hypothetical protein
MLLFYMCQVVVMGIYSTYMYIPKEDQLLDILKPIWADVLTLIKGRFFCKKYL